MIQRFLTALVLACFLGCNTGTVKGPVGQGDKGMGLKVPVLDLFKKETYAPDGLSTDNLNPEALNPVPAQRDSTPEQDDFSRYEE
ncbi:MAG: hypothetical protein DIKNOCCD_01399 [bacterium]|nr:hypothetical protein [bacterium]MBV6481673.1 hypothetical protein [bacterium]